MKHKYKKAVKEEIKKFEKKHGRVKFTEHLLRSYGLDPKKINNNIGDD